MKPEQITQADIVFVTHDHSDHLGDAFNICKRTDATFVATVELTDHARENGVAEAVGLNIGGSVEIKGIKLTVVQQLLTF